jgi:hypothetical protein
MHVTPEQSIIKVLAYFDIFNYPLTKEEIYFFLGQQSHPDDVASVLNRLAGSKRIFKLGHFYSLQNDVALRERRTAGNNKAAALIETAYKIGSFLYQFPYVRGIGISGSLSKNFADQNTDIDFFIITRSNRLWIARTFMHLFKKFTFITGHQHWYCMNYYIDEEALRIEEQNIFTATELITLLPVCGNGTMDKFFEQNNWTTLYFPNQPGTKHSVYASRSSWFKKATEWILNNRLGDAVDNYLMQMTSKRWMHKEEQQRLNASGVRMGLHNDKHFSKPNPVYFQKKVLDALEKKLKQAEAAEPVLSNKY